MADDERSRWPNSRIDDLANIVRALSVIPNEVGKLGVRMDGVEREARECHEGQERLERRLAERESQRESERRSDRRAFISAIAIIVAAIIGATATILLAAPH